MLRIGADHQRQTEKRHDGGNQALPAQALHAEDRAAEAGQQRIGEIGENGERHGDQCNRLEQAEDDGREQNAEPEREEAGARRGRLRRHPDAQIEEHEPESGDAANKRQRQRVDAVGKNQLGDSVTDAERRPRR